MCILIFEIYIVFFFPQTADIKHFGKVNIKTINLKKRYKVKLKNSGKNKFSLFRSNKKNTINKIGLTVISFIYPEQDMPETFHLGCTQEPSQQDSQTTSVVSLMQPTEVAVQESGSKGTS